MCMHVCVHGYTYVHVCGVEWILFRSRVSPSTIGSRDQNQAIRFIQHTLLDTETFSFFLSFFFFFFFFFLELRTERRALRLLGKGSTTELNPQPRPGTF